MYAAYDGPDDLVSEHGLHRLVFVSPFDSDRRRCSVFARVGACASADLVRQYILDPYRLAKNCADDRTVEDVYAVLSGARLGELL